MALITTTVGAFPKPDYLERLDELDQSGGVGHPNAAGREPADGLDELLQRAAWEVITDQVEVGIDIPGEGELTREHPVHLHCRYLHGVDWLLPDGREDSEGEDFDAVAPVPTTIGPVVLKTDYLTGDWKRAQMCTARPVRITLPGPMTTAQAAQDQYYGDEAKHGAACADALNVVVRALTDAGCPHIQIDDPGLVRHVCGALDYGVENLERAFYKCPKSVLRTLHIRGSVSLELDAERDTAGLHEAYLELAPLLDYSSVQAVSLEDARDRNDGRLFELFEQTTIILGCVDTAVSRVESMDEIRERVMQVLEHIDPERLMLAPDGGLTLLGRELALQKLKSLIAAARSI